jgi:YceI-like domain
MKKVIFGLLAILVTVNMNAQKVFTKTGTVNFSATSSLEKIEATTKKAIGVIDLSTGKMEVQLLVKSFHFEKALMEEHFNENYMESGKYADSKFAGGITNFKDVNLKKDGTYNVKVSGKLTLHGVTKDVLSDGTVTVKGGTVTAAKSAFVIKVADYNIPIPGAVKDKIAKEAKISIDLALQAMAAAKAK